MDNRYLRSVSWWVCCTTIKSSFPPAIFYIRGGLAESRQVLPMTSSAGWGIFFERFIKISPQMNLSADRQDRGRSDIIMFCNRLWWMTLPSALTLHIKNQFTPVHTSFLLTIIFSFVSMRLGEIKNMNLPLKYGDKAKIQLFISNLVRL